MLTHQNLAANVLQHTSDPCLQYDVRESDRIIGVLPLYHIYGMMIMGTVFSSGAHLVLMPKFHPEGFLQTMQEYRISGAFLVPPIILFLANHPAVASYDLSSVRFIISGAATLDSATHAAVSKQLSAPIRAGWGMTEAGGVTLTPAFGEPTPVDAVGRVVPGTSLKVVDGESGAHLGPGMKGELCVAGPQVMLGYLNRPEATAATISSDAFVHTGDLGHVDEQGNVFITGRVKELIKVKGMQVAPAELEGVLLKHAEVVDACVVGVPHERAGEIPKAYVVRAPGSTLAENEVKAYLTQRLAPYKIPGEVTFIEAIPKSPSGKMLRRLLK